MKTNLLTLTLLTLLTTPAFAQDAPKRPQDMTEEPTKTSLRALRLSDGTSWCGEVVRDEILTIALRRVDGAVKAVDYNDIAKIETVDTCPKPPSPPPQPARRQAEAWPSLALAGIGVGLAGAVGGGLLGVALTPPCEETGGWLFPSCFGNDLPGILIGGGLGVLVGTNLTVGILGHQLGYNGSIPAMVLGSVLGGALGSVTGGLAGPFIGAGLGATVGYLTTDDPNARVAILPTQGGAFASYGFSF